MFQWWCTQSNSSCSIGWFILRQMFEILFDLFAWIGIGFIFFKKVKNIGYFELKVIFFSFHQSIIVLWFHPNLFKWLFFTSRVLILCWGFEIPRLAINRSWILMIAIWRLLNKVNVRFLRSLGFSNCSSSIWS